LYGLQKPLSYPHATQKLTVIIYTLQGLDSLFPNLLLRQSFNSSYVEIRSCE